MALVPVERSESQQRPPRDPHQGYLDCAGADRERLGISSIMSDIATLTTPGQALQLLPAPSRSIRRHLCGFAATLRHRGTAQTIRR